MEKFLEQLDRGATAPSDSHRIPKVGKDRANVPLGYVPGTSASSSTGPPSYLQAPKPPTVPAPLVPREGAPAPSESAPTEPRIGTTHFSTVRSEVRSRAIRIDITDSEQWSPGDIAVLRNQEAKKVRDIGSLIFETPTQHDYEAGVEVRSVLSAEQLVEIDVRLAVTDEDPRSPESRFARFWVDEVPINPDDSRSHGDAEHPSPSNHVRDAARAPMTPEQRDRGCLTQVTSDRDRSRGSPDFGEGTGYTENESQQKGPIPEGESSSYRREHIPENARLSTVRPSNQSRIPPEDQVPKGCSLHSMEPLREWFCKGVDITSAAEYEAALCQLEDDPPGIRQYNANIRRCLDGSIDSIESSNRSVDKCQAAESSAKLSVSAHASISYAESCIECGRNWADGLSPNTT